MLSAKEGKIFHNSKQHGSYWQQHTYIPLLVSQQAQPKAYINQCYWYPQQTQNKIHFFVTVKYQSDKDLTQHQSSLAKATDKS